MSVTTSFTLQSNNGKTLLTSESSQAGENELRTLTVFFQNDKRFDRKLETAIDRFQRTLTRMVRK